MTKNGLNYKLVNLAIIALIIFLVYMTGNLWMGIVNKILLIIMPFLYAFAAAYAVHPFLEKLERKLPKVLSIIIIIASILILFGGIIYIVATLLMGQLSSLFDSIIKFVNHLTKMDLDINLTGIESSLKDIFKTILTNLGEYVSNGTVNIIGNSLSILSKLFIGFAAFIYFLIDMSKIRAEIKLFFKKKSKKIYTYIRELDHQMKKYLNGLLVVVLISFFEYTLAYSIIGHPNAILLGLLAAVANLIPYFGGMANNVVAAITAFVVSPAMFVKSIIVFTVLSALDGYLINPMVYGKTNSIHPLIVILSVFAGGILFGITGIIISFPMAIIGVTTFKFFKDDIYKVRRNLKK